MTLELVDGKLSFQDVESQQVLRHASLIDARVDVLKNPRKGHPHVFRVDLSGQDSVGESKYVFSVEADEDKALWMRVMRMHAALVGPAYASLILEYDISSNVEGQTVRASLRCLSCAYPLWSSCLVVCSGFGCATRAQIGAGAGAGAVGEPARHQRPNPLATS